jgi:hypothetical protein
MTVLDTFYLLFKNDAAASRKDVSDLEKQIDALTLKGKKRNEAEDKALKEATKRHKELTRELKDQNKQVEELGSSFAKALEGGVSAFAAYASFSGIKSGMLDAQKFNRELAIQSKVSGQNVGELKAFGAAYESAGGSAEGFLGLIKNATAIAAQAGRPLRNIRELFAFIRNDIKGLPLEQAQFRLQSQYGLPSESLAFFEQSQADYERAIKSGYELADVTKQDTDAADAFGQAWSRVAQGLDTAFTHLGSDVFPTLTPRLEAFSSWVADLKNHQGATEGFFGSLIAGVTALSYGLSKAIGSYGVKGLMKFGGKGALTAGVLAGGGLLYESLKHRDDPAKGGSGISGSARQQVIDFWKAQGFSNSQAKGWAANAQAESSFNPAASNGSHSGIYQWDAKRRANILAGTGIDVRTASLQDQLRAAAWEASSMGITPRTLPAESGQAAASISNRYEVPALTSSGLLMEAAKRASIARSYGSIPSIPGATGGGGDKTINVKIDDINVHTQATDASGIAQGIGSGLRNEFRNAIGNWDDGIQY